MEDDLALDQVTLDDLQPDERRQLTGGADLWHTEGVPRLGVGGLRVTDGPAGARGTRFTGSTSVSFPCATAMAATWSTDLVGRVGEALGGEARAKGASVLLAPTVNLHRHPLGGRNFESFSEDPHLTAELAVAYIEGVQGTGVGCAVKHLVANDQERDRMTVSVELDDVALRELYLVPFEAAVRRAGVWAVMAAYNRLRGTYCSEHPELLTTILRDEWGFDGLVMSDWFGTHGAAAITAGLDLEMPGPPMALGANLGSDVDGDALDRAARAWLDLRARTASARTSPSAGAAVGAAEVAEAVAAASMVLLRNDGALPLGGAIGSIAVLGPKATAVDIQGGGSAHVDPERVVSPLDAIRDRATGAGTAIEVVHEEGVDHLAARVLGGPDLRAASGDPGIDLTYFASADLTGAPIHRERVPRTRLFWIGSPVDGFAGSELSVRGVATLSVSRPGPWALTLTNAGPARVLVDGDVAIDHRDPERGVSFFGRGSVATTVTVELAAGDHDVAIELSVPRLDARTISGIELVATPPPAPGALDRAIAAARTAAVAVVVVGRDELDSEGHDRTGLDLPSEQDRLVREVAAVNPRTVVVVNTGSPVALPWADEVGAVLQLWYPGQEGGTALARVLFGDVDATGRLPMSFPRSLADVAAGLDPDDEGRLTYREGLFIGYRHHDTGGAAPAFCFGHGLSYTAFAYGDLAVDVSADATATVVARVEVTNIGERRGREVVQLYVRPLDAGVVRPFQELKGFAAVELAPGEAAEVAIPLASRAFEHWDSGGGGWSAATRTFELAVGSSSRAIHAVRTITV